MADLAGRASGVLGAAIAVVVLGVYAYRRLRQPEERRRLRELAASQARRPALRPVVGAAQRLHAASLAPLCRAAASPARWVLDRLPSARLGVELASVLAASAIGFYVFGLYVTLLDPDPRLLTPLDRLTGGAVELLPRGGPLLDVAALLTAIGSPWATGALVAAGALWLAVERRLTEGIALLAGWALVLGSVEAAKALVDRPRPALALVESETSSFPSAHAALALGLVALALVAARRAPGTVRAVALVLGGVALAGLVGMSRVYLRAQQMSDVAGGWGSGRASTGSALRQRSS